MDNWHVGLNPGPIVYGPLGEQVSDCMSASFTHDQNKANANLISAAPDLLAALEEALKEIESMSGLYGGYEGMSRAKAAINKAKGL